jgi:hypothetical protein
MHPNGTPASLTVENFAWFESDPDALPVSCTCSSAPEKLGKTLDDAKPDQG